MVNKTKLSKVHVGKFCKLHSNGCCKEQLVFGNLKLV